MDAYLFRQDVVRIQMTMTTMMKHLEPNFCCFFLFCWYSSSLIPKSAQEGHPPALLGINNAFLFSTSWIWPCFGTLCWYVILGRRCFSWDLRYSPPRQRCRSEAKRALGPRTACVYLWPLWCATEKKAALSLSCAVYVFADTDGQHTLRAT